MADGILRAQVRGESFDPARHPVEREVKAITYHQLSVARDTAGWWTRLYVDL
jgi:SHS2 domain-containing protein